MKEQFAAGARVRLIKRPNKRPSKRSFLPLPPDKQRSGTVTVGSYGSYVEVRWDGDVLPSFHNREEIAPLALVDAIAELDADPLKQLAHRLSGFQVRLASDAAAEPPHSRSPFSGAGSPPGG